MNESKDVDTNADLMFSNCNNKFKEIYNFL